MTRQYFFHAHGSFCYDHLGALHCVLDDLRWLGALVLIPDPSRGDDERSTLPEVSDVSDDENLLEPVE